MGDLCKLRLAIVLLVTLSAAFAAQQGTVGLVVKNAYITIPAVPDVTAGQTVLMPITVSGSGTYEINIPQLSFATYEAPSSVYVQGQSVVQVKLHINDDAQRGFYAVPIQVGSDYTIAKVRVISYVKDSQEFKLWILLIPLGIILIAAGIVMMLRSKPKRKQPEGDLITYY